MKGYRISESIATPEIALKVEVESNRLVKSDNASMEGLLYEE